VWRNGGEEEGWTADKMELDRRAGGGGGAGGGGCRAQATGPECSRTMGLMHLWSEVRLCRVIHYIGQREVLLYTYMVICCTKLRAIHSGGQRTRITGQCALQDKGDETTRDRGQSVACKINSLDAEQEYRLTIYSLYTGQRRGSTSGLFACAGQKRGSTARVLAAQERGKAVQKGCSLTQDRGETVQQGCLLLRTKVKQYNRAARLRRTKERQ
jgi:hypothetical protein